MTGRPPIDEARLTSALRNAKSLQAPESLRQELADAMRREPGRAPAHSPLRFPFGARGGWIAAAAVLLLSVGAVYLAQPTHSKEPTEAEVAEAAAQIRLVLASASRAVRNAPAAALEHTLNEGVAPAMQRTPIAPDQSGI